MARALRRWLDGHLRAQAARAWRQIAERAGRIARGEARALRDEARALQRDLRVFLRATSPRVQAAADNLSALPLPAGTDWRWRPTILTARIWRLGWAAPASGARLGQEMRVWHDGPADTPIILRQMLTVAATDLAPFALTVETMGAGLGFLALVFDLPEAAMRGLRRNHILRVELHLAAERAQGLGLRLNIQNGPNTDVLTGGLDLPVGREAGVGVVEFDLSTVPFNEARLEKLWINLVLENPGINAVELRDMILSRHPRVAM